jgi:putative flippase GtrA
MLIKTAKFFWSLKRQFAKYFIIGISSVFIDMAILIFLKEFGGFSPVLAVVFSQLVVILFVFFMNKHWSFGAPTRTHRQAIRFLSLASFNYFFSLAAMQIGNGVWGFDYRLVRLATMAMMVLWNFFLYKYWVYKISEQEIIEPGQEPAE